MQKMVDDSYAKMVEWEKKLVVLGSGELSLAKFEFTKSRCFCICVFGQCARSLLAV